MKKRLLAYHLPQFHQIKENDIWWGEGYTEWTAIRRWKPCFSGHVIRKPEMLGYYNLLESEVLEKQYQLAKDHGIEGFCFWSYWFGDGERLLEKPLEHLLLPTSQVRYCFAWANHSWWDKSTWRLLKEQKYLGLEDYKNFYKTMQPHFKNENYIKKDNKLVFSIFMPHDIPDFDIFYKVWNDLAKQDGFDGFYFIGDQISEKLKYKNLFDAFMHSPGIFSKRNTIQKIIDKLIRYYFWRFFGPIRYSYPKMMKNIYQKFSKVDNFIPTIIAGWDSTPRHEKRGILFTDFNPENFKVHINEIFDLKTKNEFIFIKSWNEWAEGNTLEPDNIYGDILLKIIKEANAQG